MLISIFGLKFKVRKLIRQKNRAKMGAVRAGDVEFSDKQKISDLQVSDKTLNEIVNVEFLWN